MTVIIGD